MTQHVRDEGTVAPFMNPAAEKITGFLPLHLAEA